MDITSTTDSLFVGIDFGTGFSAVASVDRDRVESRSFVTADFDGGSQVKTQLAWNSRESRWLWGDNVDIAVENQDITEADRIEMIKLCIESSPRTQNLREKVHSQLSQLPEAACEAFGHTSPPEFKELAGLHLKFLWSRAKKHIRECYGHRSGDVFETHTTRCWISVPKLVNLDVSLISW